MILLEIYLFEFLCTLDILKKLKNLSFRFVSVQSLEDVSTVEDAVALSLAADEFLLAPIKEFGASEIKRLVTVENVWTTLNSIVLIDDLPDACIQVSLAKKCIISTCS